MSGLCVVFLDLFQQKADFSLLFRLKLAHQGQEVFVEQTFLVKSKVCLEGNVATRRDFRSMDFRR